MAPRSPRSHCHRPAVMVSRAVTRLPLLRRLVQIENRQPLGRRFLRMRHAQHPYGVIAGDRLNPRSVLLAAGFFLVLHLPPFNHAIQHKYLIVIQDLAHFCSVALFECALGIAELFS